MNFRQMLGLDAASMERRRVARDLRIVESYRQDLLHAGRMWNQPRNPPPPPQSSPYPPMPPSA